VKKKVYLLMYRLIIPLSGSITGLSFLRGGATRPAVQIGDRSLYAEAKRRAFGHVGRCPGGDALLAARARGAEQIDPCCDRLDRRQIDMVPGPREFLACLCERGTARAALGVDVACPVRVLGERSRRARTALAGFLHP